MVRQIKEAILWHYFFHSVDHQKQINKHVTLPPLHIVCAFPKCFQLHWLHSVGESNVL